MKTRTWIILGSVAVVIAVVPYGLIKSRASRAEAEYKVQLRLARKEGIPTTPEEFKALIKPALPSENAAPYYKQLSKFNSKGMFELDQLASKVTFEPTAKNLADAKKALEDFKQWLYLADKATAMPRCWFDRDWSVPAATLFPELSSTRTAAKLVLLRGSLAASEGHPGEAIRDARAVFRMANHIREEPTMIDQLVGQAIDALALRQISQWCFRYRKELAYRAELKRAVVTIPPLDYKRGHLWELINVLCLIDLSQTKEGMAKLFGKGYDQKVGIADKLLPMIQTPDAGRILIVKASRDYWAALDLPQGQMEAPLQKAKIDLYKGMLSFPTVVKAFDMLEGGGSDSTANFIKSATARHLINLALIRAFEAKQIPRSIKTSDLISPIDGQPVKYSFDGATLTIEAGTPEDSNATFKVVLPPTFKKK